MRTHTYDAADDGTDINNYENGLGLVRADGSRKPAFTAEKNMISLLQKSNGDFYMMIWRNALSYDRSAHADIASGDAAVTITLGQSISSATQYHYDDSGNLNSSGLSINGNQITIGVPDSVQFVKLTRSAGPPLNARLGIRAYNGKYVPVNISSTAHLQASFASSIGTWETFQWAPTGN